MSSADVKKSFDRSAAAEYVPVAACIIHHNSENCSPGLVKAEASRVMRAFA